MSSIPSNPIFAFYRKNKLPVPANGVESTKSSQFVDNLYKNNVKVPDV